MSNFYSFNQVILIGNVADDPITSAEGKNPFAAINLITNKEYKTKSGEEVKESHSHRIIFYAHLAEIVNKYVKKGSRLFIESEIENNKWQDKDGSDRYTVQIVSKSLRFLDTKSKNNEQDV